jgi:aminocarboxymuconate-semialdehyde decarboxylase
MIVDMHAHIFTKETFDKLRKKHKEHVPRIQLKGGKPYFYTKTTSGGPWGGFDGFWDTDRRIEIMDDENVDMHVLSNPPYTFCYDSPFDVGLDLSKAQNDEIANVVESHPDRFVGIAVLPLQDVDGSIEELDRAIKNLGLRGVHIGTNVLGENLDYLKLWPFYERVQDLDVPIVVHPYNYSAIERMRKYYMRNNVGNPMETTFAAASVILGGVLEDFPRLKFCWAHGGGNLPYQIGRLDHSYEVRPEPRTHISKPPSEYFDLMYFDVITHSKPALKYLIESRGSDRVLMGTDYPFDMGIRHPVALIQEMESLTDEDKTRILGSNSARIFKIKT